ncbi:ribonuclease H-like domain-containing protein, partial [Tanacetum coccineum]
LNEVVQPIRSSLLSRENLLDVKDSFAIIFIEESHRGIASSSSGWIINSRANQHMTISTDNMFGIIDISDLNLVVGHPNGTLPKIKYVGNLILSKNVMLFDVLVVLEYCVSLMSVNKLIKDIRLFVSFIESKCYIQDLHLNKITRTGSENGALFEENCDNNINKLNFFDEKYSSNQTSLSPNDDKRVNFTPNDEGNVYPCTRSPQTFDGSEDNFATSMGENTSSEGTVPSSSSLNAQNLPENTSQMQPDVRRSGRNVKLPARFNDYVVGSSRKYGLEKYVSYSNLSASNMCFSTNLNKSSKPNTYYEALKDSRWVEAMTNEIEALNRNHTWTICDLPIGRKPVGSKWMFMTLPPGFDNQKGKTDKVFIELLVYVDDIVIIGNDLSEIEKFKLFFKSKFQIKDLEKLKYCIGIEVLDNKDGICLSQRKYCLELLHEYVLLAAKHVDTPLPENTTLNRIESDDDHLLDNIRNYQRLVGKLIYLTNTRPNISYVVHCLSQFMHAPLVSHLDAALRVLRCLKGSPRSGIQINKNGNLKLRAYADSDWVRCPATRKSVSEAEYGSMASATREIVANPVFHEKSKHFEIDVYLVREKVAIGVIKIEKIPTTQQIVNVLTKALDIEQHKILCEKLRLLDMFKVEKLECVFACFMIVQGLKVSKCNSIGIYKR